VNAKGEDEVQKAVILPGLSTTGNQASCRTCVAEPFRFHTLDFEGAVRLCSRHNYQIACLLSRQLNITYSKNLWSSKSRFTTGFRWPPPTSDALLIQGSLVQRPYLSYIQIVATQPDYAIDLESVPESAACKKVNTWFLGVVTSRTAGHCT
jgi:hypothetical protein